MEFVGQSLTAHETARTPRRRVYAKELKERLNCGDTWLRALENAGRIPKAHRDPGGKRKYWFDDEADAIVEGRLA